MLAIELNNNIIPRLQLEDTVGKALQLINDFKVSHLPVVSEEKYLGLISEDDLLDAENKTMHIQSLQDDFIDKCGHAPMMEVPVEFNRVLDGFLAKLKSPVATVL